MAKIIITADDYGCCNEIDAGIIDAINSGLISSVAAFTNGPRWQESLGILKRAQEAFSSNSENDGKVRQIEVGCHLTITSGKPVTEAAQKSIFLTKKGRFRLYTQLKRPETAAAKEQLGLILKKELIAQIERMEEVGIKVAHLSSHHDSLTFFPDYFEILLQVADEKGIPLRSPIMKPKGRENTYFTMVGARSILNLGKRARKQYRYFRKTKHCWFAENVKKYTRIPGAPSYLWGGNYFSRSVPINVVTDRIQAEAAVFKADDFITAVNAQKNDEIVEYCIHLCSMKINPEKRFDFLLKRSPLYYSGVDAKYFDGRQMEYKTMEFLKPKLEAMSDVEIVSWSSLGPQEETEVEADAIV